VAIILVLSHCTFSVMFGLVLCFVPILASTLIPPRLCTGRGRPSTVFAAGRGLFFGVFGCAFGRLTSVRGSSSAQIAGMEGLVVAKVEANDGVKVGPWWTLTLSVFLVSMMIAGTLFRIFDVLGRYLGYWSMP
jgi:hypothetical protein